MVLEYVDRGIPLAYYARSASTRNRDREPHRRITLTSTLKTFGVLALCALGVQAGAITAVTSRVALGANDLVAWGTAADDLAPVASPYARTSTGGVNVSAVLAGGFTIFVQNGAAFTANFAPGEVLLGTFGVDGPITINFATAIRGLGFNIVNENFGAFTGTMAFYGAGNTLFGTVNVNGTSSNANDGSAPFLGGTSSARDITSVVISVSTVGGGRALAINQMSLLTTDAPGGVIPEPSTITLFGAALAGGLWLRRRRT